MIVRGNPFESVRTPDRLRDTVSRVTSNVPSENAKPFILDEVDVIEVLEGAVRYVNTMESQLRNSSTQR